MTTSSKEFLWQAAKEFIACVVIFIIGWVGGAVQMIRYIEQNPQRLRVTINPTDLTVKQVQFIKNP